MRPKIKMLFNRQLSTGTEYVLIFNMRIIQHICSHIHSAHAAMDKQNEGLHLGGLSHWLIRTYKILLTKKQKFRIGYKRVN
jgi:hypothetical protein